MVTLEIFSITGDGNQSATSRSIGSNITPISISRETNEVLVIGLQGLLGISGDSDELAVQVACQVHGRLPNATYRFGGADNEPAWWSSS